MDNLGAIAGLLWTLASPRVAFGYLVAWMLLAWWGYCLRPAAGLRRRRTRPGSRSRSCGASATTPTLRVQRLLAELVPAGA